MSLAPSEQRMLTEIETALRRSDPKLAAMLTAFDSRVGRGKAFARLFPPTTWTQSTSLSRLRRVAPLLVATLVLGVLSLAVVLAGHAGSRSVATSRAACGIAGGQVTMCQTHAGPPPGGHAHHGPGGPAG